MPTAARFGPRELALVAVINLAWGLNIIAVRISVESVPPFTAALIRQAIVLLVCVPFLRLVPGRMRALLALGVIIGGVFLVFINLSLIGSTNVGALAIAGQLGAPFSLILAIIFLGERVGPTRLLGMALAMGGCAALVFDPRVADEPMGLIFTAIASFIWAVGSLIQRGLKGVPVLTIYAWVGLIGVLMLAPAALAFEREAMTGLTLIPHQAMLALAASAIGSTLIGHGGMAWLLQRHPVSAVVPMTLGAPVVSVIAASLVFATPLTPVMIVAGVIALTGVAIVTTRTASKGEA